jgi:hypothetical protein
MCEPQALGSGESSHSGWQPEAACHCGSASGSLRAEPLAAIMIVSDTWSQLGFRLLRYALARLVLVCAFTLC